jgi:GTPase SAR1 family protein
MLSYDDGKLIANVYNDREKLVNPIYYNDLDERQTKITNKLRIEKGFIFPEIQKIDKDDEQTERLFISGPSGVGKSSFIAQYIHFWSVKYPNCPILLFSSKKEDKQLDGIKNLIRVQIDEDILVNPFTLNEITIKKKPAYLCIFDDIEDFSNKKVSNEVRRFCEECLRLGRSYHIYSIVVHHQPTDYRATRNYLLESSAVVIFPRRAPSNVYNYLLEKKLMINKDNINLINKLNSNWVYIRRSYPNTITSNKYVLIN